MTLLITLLAAVICTFVWARSSDKTRQNVFVLCLIYWGASLMWLVDAVFALAEEGAYAFFHPASSALISDAMLGICVVALGAAVWAVYLGVKKRQKGKDT